MPVLPQAAVDGDLADPLPQRILLVENSRAFTGMLREAIEQRLELPVVIASTLAEADRLLSEDGGWFLVLTGLVLADGERVQGFVCESIALDGAEDITHHGGWRRYMASRQAPGAGPG